MSIFRRVRGGRGRGEDSAPKAPKNFHAIFTIGKISKFRFQGGQIEGGTEGGETLLAAEGGSKK